MILKKPRTCAKNGLTNGFGTPPYSRDGNNPQGLQEQAAASSLLTWHGSVVSLLKNGIAFKVPVSAYQAQVIRDTAKPSWLAQPSCSFGVAQTNKLSHRSTTTFFVPTRAFPPLLVRRIAVFWPRYSKIIEWTMIWWIASFSSWTTAPLAN